MIKDCHLQELWKIDSLAILIIKYLISVYHVNIVAV